MPAYPECVVQMTTAPPAGYPTAQSGARGKRPTGVTILAILAFLGGLAGLGAGALSFALPGMASAAGLTLPYAAVYFEAIGAVALVLGLVSFFVGYGFWTGKRWAWMVGIILYVLNIVSSAVNVALGSYTSVASIIIALIIIYYLTRPHIKAWFGRGPATPIM